MDAPLTLACALEIEERAARSAGARTARVGLGACLPLPAGGLVSFGLAGALDPTLRTGEIVSADRVVDERGNVLWEGRALPVLGARTGTVCSARRIVDAAPERAELAARTGALAVEMESATLAASGRLAGVVRAISDTPARPIGRLARAALVDGGTSWRAVAAAAVREPLTAARAARGARAALAALRRAAAELGQTRAPA